MIRNTRESLHFYCFRLTHSEYFPSCILPICYETLRLVSGTFTLTFYTELVKEDGETLGVREDQLTIPENFRPGTGPVDNFQNCLAWECYWEALPDRNKLQRHGNAVSRVCPRCSQNDETVLHAFVQ